MGLKERAAALVAEVRAYCAANADPAKATKYARYFSEGYDAWGLIEKDHPLFSVKQNEWLEAYRSLGLRGFLKVGELLFESGKYEEGALAIRFLAGRRDELEEKSFAALGRWFLGIRNWAHCDVLCGELIAPVLQNGAIPLEALAAWRESKFKFQRRAVPVAMLGLLKTATPPAVLLGFLRPLMMDGERAVQQGLGWFLRETWKRHPGPVEEFLIEWKDRAARLIFQYATEKMPASGRARFRKSR